MDQFCITEGDAGIISISNKIGSENFYQLLPYET